MAVKSTAVSVTTSATRLDRVDDTGDAQAGESLAFYNNGAVPVYIGGSDVTSSNGAPVPALSWSPSFDLGGADALYGITASGSADCRVVESGV